MGIKTTPVRVLGGSVGGGSAPSLSYGVNYFTSSESELDGDFSSGADYGRSVSGSRSELLFFSLWEYIAFKSFYFTLALVFSGSSQKGFYLFENM